MSGSGPIYARLLRLRHLRLRPVTAFVLFEGSVLIALLLALAEIVSGTGVLVVPVAVAVMVKLNDIVAGVIARPMAIAQLRAPRMIEATAVGWSPMPRPARMTTEIGWDDAVADRLARPSPPLRATNGVARGTAAVPPPEQTGSRTPRPSFDQPHPGGADGRARGNQGRFGA